MERVFADVKLDSFTNLPQYTKIDMLVNVVVRNAFMLAGIISFVLLIFGGFAFIVGAGSGDTQKTDKGKQTITGAVVGLVIIICSYWIVEILEYITGVPILR